MNIPPEQYFQPHHYNAFAEPKPGIDDDEDIRNERLVVRDALMFLGDHLWSRIEPKGWDLHRHRHAEHYVSSYHFVYMDGQPIVNRIGAMWLHYGKSSDQLDAIKTIGGYERHQKDYEDFYNAFYLHVRIQIYINESVVRAWLLFTDKNYYDRSEFLKRLRQDQAFSDRFYLKTMSIADQGFFYEVDEERLDIIKNLTKDKLLRFVRKDHGEVYSGFVKEYLPDDPRISRTAIVDEMMQNIKALYPLYELMRYKLQIGQAKTNSRSIDELRKAWGAK